ncbi:MAG TPA: sulfite exporter TauE/SafE family protein, partial [Acidimicrobiales bacterium]|nr:sulfite exporter TauE/SafE family protein [Acidimicrobiales bacterium]
ISIYSGYFGAAGGVIMLATLLAATDESLARANATKNAIAGAANLAATVVFAAYGVVHWLVAIPLAFGFLVGSRIGPVVVRRLPARPLRLAIGVAGFGLAVSLAYQAYR